MIEIKIGRHSAKYIIVMTNAPKDYDGFGTFTVNQSGKDRIVAIQEQHLDWQTHRYGSGLYACTNYEKSNCDDHYAEMIWKRIINGEDK